MGIDMMERCFSKGSMIFCSDPMKPEWEMLGFSMKDFGAMDQGLFLEGEQ